MFDHLLATEADTTGSGSYNQIEHYVLDVSPEIPVAGQPGTALADTLLILGQNGAVVDRLFYGLGAAGADTLMDQEGIPTPGQAGTDHWMLAENLNTTRDIIDDTSGVVDHIDFSAFGLIGYESNSSIAHFAGFEGGHVDPNTGLVNDYHRWYDPATGRWISADPENFRAGDADLFRYVTNVPTSTFDVSGLEPPIPGWEPGTNINQLYMPLPMWLKIQSFQQQQELVQKTQFAKAMADMQKEAAAQAYYEAIAVVKNLQNQKKWDLKLMIAASFDAKLAVSGYAQAGTYYDYAATYNASLQKAKLAAQSALYTKQSAEQEAEYQEELLKQQLEAFEYMKEMIENNENYKK